MNIYTNLLQDHDVTIKYIPSQGYFEGGYLQSVTRSLAVGCGGVVIPARNVFVKSFGARFAGKGYTGVANVTYTPQGLYRMPAYRLYRITPFSPFNDTKAFASDVVSLKI